MRKKYVIKISIIFILAGLLITSILPISFAAKFSLSEVINQATDFPGNNAEISVSDMRGMQKTIYNILFPIGIIISILGITILGIQFMTSAPEGKAEVKQRMVPFVIGCIVIFAGSVIWKITVDLIQGTSI